MPGFFRSRGAKEGEAGPLRARLVPTLPRRE